MLLNFEQVTQQTFGSCCFQQKQFNKQFNKQQIKEFTKEIRELNKEKKQLDKQDTEPKSILDYVNKCFSKSKATK